VLDQNTNHIDKLSSNLFTKRPHQINILGNQQYTEKEEKCMVLLHEAYVLIT
jgi:hypothetical protein